jgi:4-hydroxythreonine-4-phosphate dehydrogenase
MEYGKPTRATCGAVVRYIETAVRMAVRGDVQAVCTCPIHKANLHRHGFEFPGHTEFIRDLTGADDVVMMLAGPRLRVSLVTIHEAVRDVPSLLTTDLIARTIRITGDAMVRDFGIRSPRIAVAGLNPHAGEEGRFGNEEETLIEPAILEFRRKEQNLEAEYEVSGPYPPDTLFRRAYEGELDAVVAMYHDQGLIPIKLVHFHEAVNVSLGLPIIRTSVDHGTAYDRAGTGTAHSGSLEAALRLASLMARNRGRGTSKNRKWDAD